MGQTWSEGLDLHLGHSDVSVAAGLDRVCGQRLLQQSNGCPEIIRTLLTMRCLPGSRGTRHHAFRRRYPLGQ